MRFRYAVLPSVLILLLSVAAPAGARAQDNAAASPPVTLEEAVRYGLANARDVRIAGQDVRFSAEGRTRASAGRLPRLDGGADFTALSEPPAAFIAARETQIGERNVFRARLAAEQTIYDFGRVGSRVGQAEARFDVAERQEELSRERLAIDVISAFLSAKRSEELRKVAEESLATAKEHRRVAGSQYDLGVVAKNDVLAADVQTANAEADVIVAANRLELSRSRLALRMGHSGERSAAPAPGPFPVPAEAPPLTDSLRAAQEKRREVRAQAAFIREGEAAASGTRAEFAPTFFGQGGYSYETNEFNPHKSVFSVLLGGRVNLFSGFSDEAARRQALITVDRRKEELRKLKDEIALEVKSAHLGVAEAEKRKQVAEVAVARAEENLRIQNDRYKEGLAISTEVLDAQTLLTRAKVDLRNASFDLSEARYRLLAARGELLEFLDPLVSHGR